MSRAPSLKRRRRTLKKKAEELSTLCGIDVAYICFDPNGRVDTWPEDPNKVKEIILRYREVKSKVKPSASGSSASSGGEKVVAPMASQETRLDGLSEEELLRVHISVEKKLEKVRSRIAILEGNGRKRRRRYYDQQQTLNLMDLVCSPPANSETEHASAGNRCSSGSGTDSFPTCGSSMIIPPGRSNSPISDPKSEWGKLISL